MNDLSRRDFLRSSAGAVAAAAIDVKPCRHHFDPTYVTGTVCTKCGVTLEALVFGHQPRDSRGRFKPMRDTNRG